MRTKERDRLKILEQMAAQLISTGDGAARLGVCRRQVQRLVAEYRRRGDGAAIHGLRGRPANRARPPAQRRAALERVGDCYGDYGPTLAAEALAEAGVLHVNRETLRLWLIAEGMWKGMRKGRRQRRRRERRRCFGELVQMDTSEHAWLEERGPKLMLISMIDDATGYKLLRFFQADTSEANMELIGEWIARHGRPVALYTDAASHFRPPQSAGRKPPRTQIERALGELDLRLIVARSPQAKGRVERSHGTDQDRLVKGLRQAGATTLEAANRYLEEAYLPKINAKFAKPAADPADAHRSAVGFDLEAILCLQQRRKVANDWTVSIDGRLWQIEPGHGAEQLRGQRVLVEHRRDGALRLRWGDCYLRFSRAAGPLPRRLDEEKPPAQPRAVDSAAPWTAAPTLPRRPACPQGLNNSAARSARGRVIHRLHSPDDDPPNNQEPAIKTLKTPVRIPNCTRKPKPDHPWR